MCLVFTRLLWGLVFIVTSATAAAAIPPPLKPAGPWVLDYDATQCIASRQYGADKDAVTFAIRPAPNGETYELLVGRARYGPMFAEELNGSVDFGRGPIKAWLLHYGGSKKKISVDQFRISAAEMSQAKTATSVYLRAGDGTSANISLTAMPQLLKGMEDCTADLMRFWNERAEADGRISVPAKGDLRRIFNPSDYPSEAFNKHQQGTVQYLLLIDEKGKVAGCHVMSPSGVPALDAMGCAVVIERAKFSPAEDANHKPMRSAVVTPPIVWRLE